MKNNILRTVCAAALLVPMLWSCQRERIEEEAAKASGPAMHAAISGTGCGEVRTLPLTTADFGPAVDFCTDGISQIACGPNNDPWGTIDFGKYTNDNSTANLNLDATLAAGWFFESYQVIVSPSGGIQTNGALPVTNTNWTSTVLNPLRNNISIDLPVQQYEASCFEWSVKFDVVALSLFGGPVTGSNRSLYAYDPNGAGSPFVIDACYDACPANAVTLTKGSCQGCRSKVTTTFNGCNSVDISACKNIRRVVVVYDDCSRQIFANLNTPSFHVASNGKTVSHVFVRSGCKNNDDDNGDDNGSNGSNNANNYRRFRFNGPCHNGGC